MPLTVKLMILRSPFVSAMSKSTSAGVPLSSFDVYSWRALVSAVARARIEREPRRIAGVPERVHAGRPGLARLADHLERAVVALGSAVRVDERAVVVAVDDLARGREVPRAQVAFPEGRPVRRQEEAVVEVAAVGGARRRNRGRRERARLLDDVVERVDERLGQRIAVLHREVEPAADRFGDAAAGRRCRPPWCRSRSCRSRSSGRRRSRGAGRSRACTS